MKKYILFVLLIAATMSGCNSDPDYFMKHAKPPVTILAISPDGDIVLSDGDGNFITYNKSFYFSKAISKSKKVGDVLK